MQIPINNGKQQAYLVHITDGYTVYKDDDGQEH